LTSAEVVGEREHTGEFETMCHVSSVGTQEGWIMEDVFGILIH